MNSCLPYQTAKTVLRLREYTSELTESVTRILKLRLQNYGGCSDWADISQVEQCYFWIDKNLTFIHFVEEDHEGHVVSRRHWNRSKATWCGWKGRVDHSESNSWESSKRRSQRVGGASSLKSLKKWQRLIPLAKPLWCWARWHYIIFSYTIFSGQLQVISRLVDL